MSGTCNFGLCSRSSRRALSSVVISINCRRRQRRLPRLCLLYPRRRCRPRCPACSAWPCRSTRSMPRTRRSGCFHSGITAAVIPRTAMPDGILRPHRRASACCGDRYRHQRGARSRSRSARTAVVLEHVVGTHFYRTHYTNLASVAAEVVVDATVVVGQTIGTAGTITAVIGNASITYAMTHFQLDDLEFHREVANPKAVTPNPSSARRRSRCSIASGARRSISMSSSSLLRPTRVKRRLPCAPGPAPAATVRRGFALRAGVLRIPTNCWSNPER